MCGWSESKSLLMHRKHRMTHPKVTVSSTVNHANSFLTVHTRDHRHPEKDCHLTGGLTVIRYNLLGNQSGRVVGKTGVRVYRRHYAGAPLRARLAHKIGLNQAASILKRMADWDRWLTTWQKRERG